MDQLNCYICQNRVPGSLDGLTSHLTRIHGLTITRGGGNEGFECGQNGCSRTYQHFYSLRRHIRENHLHQAENEPVVNNINDEHNQDDELHNNYNNDDQANILHERNFNPVADNDNNMSFNLRQNVIRMIGRFQNNSSVTGSILTEVLCEFEQLLMSTQEFFKRKIHTFLEAKELLNDRETRELLDTIDFDNPFYDLKTLNQQIDALASNCNYIEPIEVPLGYRIDNILDKKSCTYKPKMIMETFQYVPLIKTLELVLSSPQVRYAIENEQKTPDGILDSFLNEQYAQVHPLFSQYPNAIRIQLYYDEFEIVNPLGSKTAIHKLGAFYYIIQNLPPHMNSELSSVHVLCLCSDADVKKYGFSQILAPFLDDLAKIESDEGVLIHFDEGDYLLRGTIAAFSGDGLAVHDVFNLLGPSANKFCRMCLLDRHDFHIQPLNVGQERTERLYNEHLAALENSEFSNEVITETGVRGNCCLNSSRYFHISLNKIFDPMHDFLCGICPMIIKLILHEYILTQKKFDITYFDGMISSFNYGYTERLNKPSANFSEAMLRRNDYSLSQKAMQIWCLVRAFPFS